MAKTIGIHFLRKGCGGMAKRKAGGRRTASSYQQKRRAYETYSRSQSGRGKREAEESQRSSGQLRQLVVSGLILVSVVAVKLLSPQTLEPLRTELLHLMHIDTDVAAVFADLGRAVSDKGLGGAIGEAYVAVFGGSDVPASGAAELPENVCMTQQVLGFAYAAPLEGAVNDYFGYREHPVEGVQQFHYGLDLQGDSGDVICAFADGTVTVVAESSALGKYVTVLHENGYTSLYAHCSRITASSGQQVRLGDPIAEVGKTGQTTGPHLHFELYKDTLYLNPIYYVV